MDHLKRRQKTRKRLYSKLSVAVLALLFLALIHPTWKIFQKSRESAANFKRAEAELVELEARRERLASDVAYLGTEHGRDQEIRNKFGVAREGETMVVIVRNELDTGPTQVAETRGFFARTWSGFLSIFGVD